MKLGVPQHRDAVAPQNRRENSRSWHSAPSPLSASRKPWRSCRSRLSSACHARSGQCWPMSVRRREVPGDGNHHVVAASRPAKRHDVIAIWAGHLDGLVCAIAKQRRQMVPQRQQPMGQRKLDPPIGPVGREFAPIRRGAGVERRLARPEIDRPAVVRIDQRQVPGLGALIEIRNARHRRLEHKLRQAVQRAEQRHAARECFERLEKCAGAIMRSSIARINPRKPFSYASSGLSQLVSSLPSRAALIA